MIVARINVMLMDVITSHNLGTNPHYQSTPDVVLFPLHLHLKNEVFSTKNTNGKHLLVVDLREGD